MIRAAWCLLGLAILPALAGSYIGQVLMLVGLYILMGMGLNLEVGLAGLLDLGFVAFFAVGAYATALLTADNPHALMHLSYWAAMPVSVVLAIGVGVLFGIPVLGGSWRLPRGRDDGARRNRSRDRFVGFRVTAVRRRARVAANPKPAIGGFTLGNPGVVVFTSL